MRSITSQPHLDGEDGAAGNLGKVAVGGHEAARLVQLAGGVVGDVLLPGAVKVDERPGNHLPPHQQQQAQVVAGEADAAARLRTNQARA